MPTNNIQNNAPIPDPLSLQELSEILVKHYGLYEGKYDLALEFQIGVGQVGPNPESQFPGAMVSISKIGLIQTESMRQTTVDASIVNPIKRKRKKSVD